MEGLTLGHILERAAANSPDAEAVVARHSDGQRNAATYSVLDERTNRVANGLIDRGLSSGDTVAVYTRNALEAVEVYLGAMKAGVLPVPINTRFGPEEVLHVLADCDVSCLVVDDEGLDVVASLRSRSEWPVDSIFHTGSETPAFAEGYDAFLDGASRSVHPIDRTRLDDAMILYTSGTTGRPKGCVLTHDNVIQGVVNPIVTLSPPRDGRFLCVMPLYHIAGFAMLVKTLYLEATTVLLPSFDPPRVLEAIESEAITNAVFVPAMARKLLAVEDFADYDLSSFENFGIGAAPSGERLRNRIVDRFDCELRNAFGQTELSGTTTLLEPEDTLERPDSVGRPVPNVQVSVVDPDTGEPVGPGEVGQIRYRGPTVFDRYCGMPEETRSVIDEDGWFHSNDLVCRDEEGYVYLRGRLDDMIVSGGENVYPSEVEEALHEHAAVAEVAVVGAPDDEWGERVKAVVVLADGASVEAATLQEFVGERIADYKKPREITFREELPRTASGKVQKTELR